MIHAGGNDVANDMALNDIIEDTAYLGHQLQERGVCKIAISGMTPRKGMKESIPKLNNLFRKMCITNGFDFIDNSNIKYGYVDYDGEFRSHLSFDRIHLNYDGVEILENNFIHYLKNLKLGNGA